MANNLKVFCNLFNPLEKCFLANAYAGRIQIAGMKFYYPKEPVDKSEWPENRRLRIVRKQPLFNFKAPKMYKMITRMRGPEEVHNELLYKGYGIKALLGGRMKFEHFEAVRRALTHRLDLERMFALWRIDDPWQPLAKKGTGKKLGGGKGSIHHYCTPIKAECIIMELAGDIHEKEARKILHGVANFLPFPTRVVSQGDLEKEKANSEWVVKNNLNPYDMEYVIKNNMGGCKKWLSPYDYLWFGKYT